MFTLSDSAIDVVALRAGLGDERAGALATFEGWVRNHNEGKPVTLLEYEAYGALAVKEGERIIEEAKRKFDILDCVCVHRVGALKIGEMAVWVGVTARHRDAAFQASRYIIDEVKARVPVWKKEHYATGATEWVNCAHEHESKPGSAIDKLAAAVGAGGGAELQVCPGEAPDMSRLYIRQTVLPQIGVAGQEKLRKARVLIIGAGGLGCPALAYLAAAGVGTVGVCDGDVVDVTNLHRQILFGVDDIGKQKALVACAKLQRQYPAIIANPHKERLTAKNAEALVSAYDVVLDCTDNFETKFLVNDVCRELKKTIIQASVYQFEGQLTASFADGGGQCLRCLWTQTPEAGCVGSCTESGVMGATVGMFGSLQAMEAIKAICGIPSDLHDNMVLFDLLALESRKIRRKVSRSCTLCGEQSRMDFHPTAKAQPTEVDASSDWQLDILDMSSSELARFVVVDIREPSEDPSHLLQSLLRLAVTSMPLSMVELDSLELNRQKDYLFICQRGRRSDDLVARLRQRGYTNVFSLVGGVEAVRRKFIA